VGQHIGADLSHGAGFVVDDDRLAQTHTHFLGVKTPEHVDQRSRWRGDDEVNGPRGIIIAMGRVRRADKNQRSRDP
jgi:hypothetical protein